MIATRVHKYEGATKVVPIFYLIIVLVVQERERASRIAGRGVWRSRAGGSRYTMEPPTIPDGRGVYPEYTAQSRSWRGIMADRVFGPPAPLALRVLVQP
jgi:hypothetical protein